ncbi:hypothetical protein N7535_007331 [Penicillium sp. DV-2018c]|nr:hypothetical protein N7535_007331 [Penicillium sp. DV-2018c]
MIPGGVITRGKQGEEAGPCMLGEDGSLTTLQGKVKAACDLPGHLALRHTVCVPAAMSLDPTDKRGKMVEIVLELGGGELHDGSIRSTWANCTRLRAGGLDVDAPIVCGGLLCCWGEMQPI